VICGACNACVAWTGIRRNQHDTGLGSKSLCAGFDHESFLVAGQPCKVEQHRDRMMFDLRRLIYGEAHRQADNSRVVAVKSLYATKTGVFADAFEHVCPP
jgi:hypothetical protein